MVCGVVFGVIAGLRQGGCHVWPSRLTRGGWCLSEAEIAGRWRG